MISTLNAELQLFLPVWVRARGLAIYMMTFTGSMTVGALLWGLVAEAVGLQVTFFAAAAVMLGGVVAGVFCAYRRPVTSIASWPSTGPTRGWRLSPSWTADRSS